VHTNTGEMCASQVRNQLSTRTFAGLSGACGCVGLCVHENVCVCMCTCVFMGMHVCVGVYVGVCLRVCM